MSLEKVRQGLCPLGHGELDRLKRCIKCSANWVIIKPENGMYQSSGFGSRYGITNIYDSSGNLVTTFTLKDKS